MALGLMRMFGFRILENFNYPYISRSIREFWRRWHISLSNWFLDYLYVPLGGNRHGTARAYRNLVIVFLLCGLWHGASWPFVLWGIWHGLFLVAERAGVGRVLERLGPVSHVYALAVVMGGWVLFRSSTLARAEIFYTALLGFGTGDPVQRPLREFLDPLVATTLVFAVAGATPIARHLGEWLEQLGQYTSACLRRRPDRRHRVARPGADHRHGLPRGRHLQPVHLLPVLTRPMDPLRLPTVPPPAPATHPWRDRTLIAIVAVLLPVMATLDPLRGAAIKWEQRLAATWPPVAKLASPATFGTAFGQAFADRFGMRSALIVAQHWALVDIFGVSPVDNVMIGRDGWLFWLGEDARSLDRNYRGTRRVPDFEVRGIRRRGEAPPRVPAVARDRVPDDDRTGEVHYLPGVPSFVGRPWPRSHPAGADDGSPGGGRHRAVCRSTAGASRGQGSRDALLPDRLALEPRRSGRGLRRDHASRADPAAGTTRVHRPTGAPAVYPGRDVFWGDQSKAMGIPFLFTEPDYLPLRKVTRDPGGVGLVARQIGPNPDGHFRIYEHPNADLPRLVMNRDSMANALIPMLSENFHRSVYVQSLAVERRTIEREHPDIVIDEIVERGMIRIAQFPTMP
jgi:hypothetical protein